VLAYLPVTLIDFQVHLAILCENKCSVAYFSGLW